MRQVGIFRMVFPLSSETFISGQALALTRYRPTFLLRSKLADIGFDNIAISDLRFGRVRELLFSLTRYPRLFGSSTKLQHLNLVHAHFGPDGTYAMGIAKMLRVPLVVTFHGFDATSSRSTLFNLRKPSLCYFVLLEKRLQQQASAVIAVSDFIQRQLVSRGYPEEKVIRHYIGVDTEIFKPAERLSSEPFILCVGRHEEKKGIPTLIRAFASVAKHHPNVSLLQVGSGTLTQSFISLAESLGIRDRVKFLGAQPHSKVVELMRAARLFALPSQTAASGDSEALGIVFNEASACGIPIAATLHGGIPEAVLDGDTGLLAPEKDHRALAERINQLLSDTELAKKMGRRGREYVCETFNIHKQTLKLENLYDSLIEKL